MKFVRKSGSNSQNLKKVLRKSQGSISTIYSFIGQKLIFRCYCIENIKDRIQIQVCNINKESANHFSQFTSVKVEKNLRKSQARFREKLRKLRLSQHDGFLIKKTCRWKQKTKGYLQNICNYTYTPRIELNLIELDRKIK